MSQKKNKMSSKEKFLRTENIDEVLNKPKRKPTMISLFTGCGGTDLGFCKAGWETRVMIEWDKFACDTLRTNWTMDGLRKHWDSMIKYFQKNGDKKQADKMKKQGVWIPKWYHSREPVILQEDITKLSSKRILEAAGLKVGEVDCITGSPPCQGFSLAGRRIVTDKRNDLYKSFVRIVKEILPKTFFLENVPGMTSMLQGKVMIKICKDFAKAGYDVSWDILNAADYGVPQNRKRVIMIGRRADCLIYPEKGNIRLHLGIPGEVEHPAWFIKRYKKVQ